MLPAKPSVGKEAGHFLGEKRRCWKAGRGDGQAPEGELAAGAEPGGGIHQNELPSASREL